MRGLRGKRVLVAGSATGIGAATAVRLGVEGTKVVLGDINDDGARAAYSASKAGVNTLSRHLAKAYGKQGVRANSGAVFTESCGVHRVVSQEHGR